MTLPGVTIIVPALDCEKGIRPLLDSLLRLDYPRELLQILLVDNGSTDRTREVIGTYPVTLLEERRIRSSYAARNRALREVRHEVVAFTDADCVVTPSWVKEGVGALARADIVAGRVRFSFSPKPSAAELFDALSHMQNDELIRKYSGAATANLFVKAVLFRTLGPFRSDVRSGGDMMWTRGAVAAGHTLAYAPEAVVCHPARPLGELLVKGFRLGTGIHRMKRDEGEKRGRLLYDALRALLPPRITPTRKLVSRNGEQEFQNRVAGIWWAAYLYGAARGLGVIYGLSGLPLAGSGAREQTPRARDA